MAHQDAGPSAAVVRKEDEVVTPVRTRDLKDKKRRGERIAMRCLLIQPARLLDRAVIDALLCWRLVGMVILVTHHGPCDARPMFHHTPPSRAEQSGRCVATSRSHLPGSVAMLPHAGSLLQKARGRSEARGGRAVIDVSASVVGVRSGLSPLPQSVHHRGGSSKRPTRAMPTYSSSMRWLRGVRPF